MSNEGLRGKVYVIPQIDETLTKDGYGADAKAVGERFVNVENRVTETEKMDYYENITLNGNLMAQGRCYYLESRGQVFIHILCKATSDIESEQLFAILNSLSKPMRTTDNVGVIVADGTVYPFKFNGKDIVNLTAIPTGKVIGIDVCIGLA